MARLVLSEDYIAALPEGPREMPEKSVREGFGGSLKDLRVAVESVLEVRDIEREFTMESFNEERRMSVGDGDEHKAETEASRETGDEVRSETSCTKQREKKQGSKKGGSEGKDTSKRVSVENPNAIEEMSAEEVAEMLIRHVCKGLPGEMVHLVESALRSAARSYPLYGRSLLEPSVSPEELASILLEVLLKGGEFKGVYHVTVGFIKKAQEGKIAASEMGDRGE